MNIHADKMQENKSHSVANALSKKQSDGVSTFQFVDNRPEVVDQRKLQEMANNSLSVTQLRTFQDMANNSPQAKQAVQLRAIANNRSAQQQHTIQKKENKTGLPDALKSGIETFSSYSMNDVKVHYNSDRPVQLQAHAYAQGTDIHIASGQEKHLPHEAWHVVQQKQGRVSPTMQLKSNVSVNDDVGLEKEADVMGAKSQVLGKDFSSSVQMKQCPNLKLLSKESQIVQKTGLEELSEPKVNQLNPYEFELQSSLMTSLNEIVEALPPEQKAEVFRLATVELLIQDGTIVPYITPPVLPVPAGIAPGSELITEEALAEGIRTNVMNTLRSSGQLAYIEHNNLINEEWRIIVDVDFYYQRPAKSIGFHKDTVGRSLFVNLNFNNEQEIMGPEFILNPPGIDKHDQHIATKLPRVFLDDLVSERQRLGLPSEISNTRIPAHGMVSFVDEMIHHTTPFLGHRGLTFSPDELTRTARELQTAKRLITLINGTSKAKGNSRDFLRDYIGLDERQIGFLFDRVIGDSVPTGYIKTKLLGNPEFEKMKKLAGYQNNLHLLQRIAAEDRPFEAGELVQAGILPQFISFLIDEYDKHDLSTVSLAGCEDACDKDIKSEEFPIMPEGMPRLERRMSMDLNEENLPPPPAEKRQFFRTWVQAIRRK